MREWIRSSRTVISIHGDDNAKWYLNGKPLKSYYPQVELGRGKVHKLTKLFLITAQKLQKFFWSWQRIKCYELDIMQLTDLKR